MAKNNYLRGLSSSQGGSDAKTKINKWDKSRKHNGIYVSDIHNCYYFRIQISINILRGTVCRVILYLAKWNGHVALQKTQMREDV